MTTGCWFELRLVRCEELLVHFGKFGPLFGKVFFCEDGVDGAGIYAQGAVDAVRRINVELGILVATMDAVHRADINASLVFDVDAGLSDDVGHVRLG